MAIESRIALGLSVWVYWSGSIGLDLSVWIYWVVPIKFPSSKGLPYFKGAGLCD